MLVDNAVIFIKAGNGGNGIVSLRREAYVPKGGPDGGDGGNGGSVILKATQGVDTLLDMAGKHHWKATSGSNGGNKCQSGANGQDLIIKVPPGTLVYDDQTGELLEDLDEPDKQIIAAKGGKAGFGNYHFKSSTNQTPRTATPGEAGEEKTLRLELKLIADVGLVGKPNAGKSTLLSRISRATPKIADYPFTTLAPHLGIAELSDQRRLVIADIPGLIEGAHQGAGLGHEFLRHIERTGILVHIIEIDPIDGSDPIENYHAICNELKNYSDILADKLQIVAVNKIDMMPDDNALAEKIETIKKAISKPVLPISAVSGKGVRQLLEKCWTPGS